MAIEADLQELDLDVSVEASTRIGSRFQSAGYQLLAVCDNTHVVAIANGRFVDLYGFGTEDPHRLAFLTQITLGDYINCLPSAQIDADNRQEIEILLATCVLIPIPGFLLIGGVVVSPEHEFEDSSTVESKATLLLGFRLYSNSVSQFIGSVEDKSRHAPVSVQVHFSFLEPVVGVPSRGIRALLKYRDEMTPDSGAVVIIFDGSVVFGIFKWNERFSDRLVCLAQHPKPLIAAANDPNGRYLVLGDAEGQLSLLDFRNFPWDGYGVSPKDHQVLGGKRLQLGVCSRSGVVTRDNPLEQVRVVYTAAGTDSNCGYTCIRWWHCGVHGQEKEFVLAGKQDGSLSVLQLAGKENDGPNSSVMELKMIQMYPGLATGMHDAIRSISEPLQVLGSTFKSCWIEFCTISDMRWRVWRVKIDEIGSSSERHRLKWPSVKDSLAFPGFMLQAKACAGIAILNRSTEFSRTVVKVFSAVKPSNNVRGPISLVIAGNRLQAMGLSTKSPTSSKVPSEFESDTNASVTEDNECGGEDGEDNGFEETRKELTSTDAANRKSEQHSSGPTTIQDKYRLPPMKWKAKASASNALSHGDVASPREDGGRDGARNTSHSTKISRVDYDQRVASVIQRVDNLSGVMKTMRTSFQLFSSDIQQHMNLVSEQLEELNRRVAQSPPKT